MLRSFQVVLSVLKRMQSRLKAIGGPRQYKDLGPQMTNLMCIIFTFGIEYFLSETWMTLNFYFWALVELSKI